MTYSVLHLKSIDNDKYCGVWCSESKNWEFKGEYEECFIWKHKKESSEQEISNLIYDSTLKKERSFMFSPTELFLNKYFIYSLSHNDTVFYIGYTKDLKKRYLGHINCCDMQTRGFILSLRSKNELPDINIIYSIDNKTIAKKLERETISEFAKHNKLCNATGNNPANRIKIEYNEGLKATLPFPNSLRDINSHIEGAIKKYVTYQ